MKRQMMLAVLCIAMSLSTGCATQVAMQNIHQPLSFAQEGVAIEVVGVGHSKEWTEVEIAVSNTTEHQVQIKDREIYVKNEKGYYVLPYQDYEINQKIQSRTGQYVNPLTLGALAAGITALILPQSHDRETAARIAGAFLLGAVGKEVAEGQAAGGEQRRKGDTVFRNYTIPPDLKLGGKLYYPPMEKASGLKMIMYVEGRARMFELDIKDAEPGVTKPGGAE